MEKLDRWAGWWNKVNYYQAADVRYVHLNGVLYRWYRNGASKEVNRAEINSMQRAHVKMLGGKW